MYKMYNANYQVNMGPFLRCTYVELSSIPKRSFSTCTNSKPGGFHEEERLSLHLIPAFKEHVVFVILYNANSDAFQLEISRALSAGASSAHFLSI